MKKHLKEDRRQDLIDSILLNYEDYADNVGIAFIGPTSKELESYTDEELEAEFETSESDLRHSQVDDDEKEDDFDSEEDNQYWDDLDSKSSEDSEIEDLAALGPEDGEEFPKFTGMGRSSSFRESVSIASNKRKIMKLTARQLRRIIRETLEETMESRKSRRFRF